MPTEARRFANPPGARGEERKDSLHFDAVTNSRYLDEGNGYSALSASSADRHHRLPWQQRLPRLGCVSQTHHDRGSRTSTRS